MIQDLEKRTFIFSVRLIKFLRTIKIDVITSGIINQVTRSGTSIGANYREAKGAESTKDFQHKCRVAKKEAKETQYWMGLIKEGLGYSSEDLNWLINETQELIKILGKMGAPKDKTY